MKFERDKAYPLWNPSKLDEVPGIPSWDIKFGDIRISFSKGEIPCRVNKNILKNGEHPCGDYKIHLTIPECNIHNTVMIDTRYIKILKEFGCNMPVLRKISTAISNKFKTEKELVEMLNSKESEKVPNMCKAFLYYSWHRCIIEERIYSNKHERSSYLKGKNMHLEGIK